MPRPVRLTFVLALALGVAGCRQADGPTPAPSREQSNEIGDISRDLINIVNKDPQALEELRSDLLKYASNDESARRIGGLVAEISQALAGARLDDQTAQSLARTVWVGLNGKELSDRQVQALEREVKTTLASTGVAENRAQAIADRLGAVQKTMTQNPRRWYQVF
jgi:hypothetical protein